MSSSTRQFRWGDALIIVLAVIVVIFLSLYAYGGRGGEAYAMVSNGEQTWRFSLDEPLHAKIPGLLGDTTIHVHEGMIAIEDSPCPTKSCTTMGGIMKKGQWLVCMPNGVFITIEGSGQGDSEVDDVAG